MHFFRTAVIAGIAAAALAGAALAARDDNKMMLIAHPDGTVEHIPVSEVQLVAVPAAPADFFTTAFGPDSAIAEMDRMAAAMEAQAAAMMRDAAMTQSGSQSPGGQGMVMTNAQGQPVGVMQYSFVSSSTDANGCTQTISYSSDGAAGADQPKVIRTSAGACSAQAAPAPAIAPATRAPHPATQTVVMPTARPAPMIVPVGAPNPHAAFTPTRV